MRNSNKGFVPRYSKGKDDTDIGDLIQYGLLGFFGYNLLKGWKKNGTTGNPQVDKQIEEKVAEAQTTGQPVTTNRIQQTTMPDGTTGYNSYSDNTSAPSNEAPAAAPPGYDANLNPVRPDAQRLFNAQRAAVNTNAPYQRNATNANGIPYNDNRGGGLNIFAGDQQISRANETNMNPYAYRQRAGAQQYPISANRPEYSPSNFTLLGGPDSNYTMQGQAGRWLRNGTLGEPVLPPEVGVQTSPPASPHPSASSSEPPSPPSSAQSSYYSLSDTSSSSGRGLPSEVETPANSPVQSASASFYRRPTEAPPEWNPVITQTPMAYPAPRMAAVQPGSFTALGSGTSLPSASSSSSSGTSGVSSATTAIRGRRGTPTQTPNTSFSSTSDSGLIPGGSPFPNADRSSAFGSMTPWQSQFSTGASPASSVGPLRSDSNSSVMNTVSPPNGLSSDPFSSVSSSNGYNLDSGNNWFSTATFEPRVSSISPSNGISPFSSVAGNNSSTNSSFGSANTSFNPSSGFLNSNPGPGGQSSSSSQYSAAPRVPIRAPRGFAQNRFMAPATNRLLSGNSSSGPSQAPSPLSSFTNTPVTSSGPSQPPSPLSSSTGVSSATTAIRGKGGSLSSVPQASMSSSSSQAKMVAPNPIVNPQLSSLSSSTNPGSSSSGSFRPTNYGSGMIGPSGFGMRRVPPGTPNPFGSTTESVSQTSSGAPSYNPGPRSAGMRRNVGYGSSANSSFSSTMPPLTGPPMTAPVGPPMVAGAPRPPMVPGELAYGGSIPRYADGVERTDSFAYQGDGNDGRAPLYSGGKFGFYNRADGGYVPRYDDGGKTAAKVLGGLTAGAAVLGGGYKVYRSLSNPSDGSNIEAKLRAGQDLKH